MAEQLPVIEIGNPLLRQMAQPVLNLQSPAIQQLIDDLLFTVRQVNGVGIAAPQVGQSLQIFVVASRPNPRYPTAPEMEPTVMINPRIVSHSDEVVKGWEGCLSVPGIRGQVPRYKEIEIEYSDRNGNPHRQVLTDFIARIFQHELDHLNGKVFLDRLESNREIISHQEYQKLIDAGQV